MVKTKKDEQAYGAKQITVLEGLDPVRRRPGMYIGSTGPQGLHHLIWEVMDNSFDEAMAGHGDQITLRLLPENMVSVEDHGRGIPVDIHPQHKVSALELVLTKLHAGGKFGDGGYKVSGGLHGVGVSVVNALSTYLKAEVKREGQLWVQEYARGIPKAKVRPVGKASGTGTMITFQPDSTIFETTEFHFKTILDHLRQQAYLTKGIKLVVSDERDAQNSLVYAFYFEGGVASYVRHINHGKESKHKNVFYVHTHDEATDVEVEVALQYTGEYYESVHCFANNITNPEGGMHLSGFRSALTRELNNYARNKGLLKEKDQNLTGEDVREGLTAVISVKIREPQFEGQTKAKLGNPEARTAVESVFGEAFKIFLEEHPADAEAIIAKCFLAAQARSAARAARDTVLRKGALEGLTLPGKLSDCSSRDPNDSELFIVEGDSAGGCFSIDTRVTLADGRTPTFGELCQEWEDGKQNYCYTIKTDGHIGIGKIENVRKTKSFAEVIKVILDNGSEIVCTPDHLFMLRNGSYVQAQNLKNADSLMPFRQQLSRKGKRITIEGYEMIYDPLDLRWIFTHMLSDEYNLEQGVYTKKDGEHREKRKQALDKTYFYKALSILHDIYEGTGQVDVEHYETMRSILSDRSLLRTDTLVQRFFHGDSNAFEQAVVNFNHKIKSIERLKTRIDVFDLEVPETHNFALANGIFVHNSAKQGRDREHQAILPLRGKILNVERARLDKMLANNEIKSLVIALGTNIGEAFDIASLRYEKIVIMTDADVDGAHIRTLLLTLFFRYLPELIHQGHIYIAQPPLYRVNIGKNFRYAYSDEEKQKVIEELLNESGKKGKEVKEEEEQPVTNLEVQSETEEVEVAGVKVNIQRYKGLGEMNPDQLWDTTMDPNTRVMKKVTIEDAERADEVFDVLMGSDVAPRKRFIQTHAKTVKNLDV